MKRPIYFVHFAKTMSDFVNGKIAQTTACEQNEKTIFGDYETTQVVHTGDGNTFVFSQDNTTYGD